MRKPLAFLAVGATLALANVARAADATFNFDAFPGDGSISTPFSDTNSGVTATFDAPSGDPGGFGVFDISGQFATLTGNALLTPGPAALNNLQLSILFDQPITGVTLDFALNSADTAPDNAITLDAFDGATLVGSKSGSGTTPSGFLFPEGVLAFSSATPFDLLLLSSPALDFGVDNIVVTLSGPGTVPEPGALALLGGAGFAGLAAFVRRQRR